MYGSVTRLVIAAILAAGVIMSAQDQALFHSGARTVAIYATVHDHDGKLVTTLTRDDFEVRDNGKPVDLAVFSSDPEPITIVIMLDTSGSMTPYMSFVTAATEQLIDRLQPADQARLGAFGDHTLLSQRFTSDHQELLKFLHTKVNAGGMTPLWNALDLGMVYLKDIPGRRVVLVFTDGVDTTTGDHGLDAVRKRADNEEVMIYAIGCWSGPDGGVYGDDRPDPNLRKLADHTGGGYSELTWKDDLNSTFGRVADELHHQYVLGFTPKVLDGKVHKLEVRVKPRDLTVRARETYLASSDK